jgi:hypothetical protein
MPTIRWIDQNPEGVVDGFHLFVDGEEINMHMATLIDDVYHYDIPSPCGEVEVYATAHSGAQVSGPSNIQVIPEPSMGMMLAVGIVFLLIMKGTKHAA